MTVRSPRAVVRPTSAASTCLVSIIITTKNRSHQVGEAIESVLRVDRRGFEVEVIVVDDGSTDDTSAVLERYPIRVVRTDGVGMAKARSIGLEHAHGDFVGWLDDDDVLLPAAIGAQLDRFAERPDFGLVHAQAQMVTADLAPFAAPFPESPLRSEPRLRDLLGYFPQIGTIITRRDVAIETGPYDPSLPGDNDWDWLLRVARRHPVGAAEVPVLLFRQREEPHEDLAWRRFPAIGAIFRRHTKDLPMVERIRLRPVLWRHRGWGASVFLSHAETNWRNGQRRRSIRSLNYAVRMSWPHTLIEGSRRAFRIAWRRVR